MPLPRTYLSQAPSGLEDQMGRCISSTDLIKNLKRCNRQITVPQPEHYKNQGWVFSDAHIEGQTSIWWGNPPGPGDISFASTKPNKKAMKITSIVLSPTIPEFTQFNSQTGLIENKGWREVCRRVIMCGAATKEKVEKVFKVSLDYEGDDDTCEACRKKGLTTKAFGARRLCVDHEMATLGISERQAFIDYLRKQTALRGESQVGYTTKEDMCHSSPSTGAKPPQKTSPSPCRTSKPQASTPSPRSAESGPEATST